MRQINVMAQIRSVLVDDERNSLQNLGHKLAEFCPDVEIVGMAESPEEALVMIRKQKPDAVFLDIEMPRMNGLRMLEEMKDYTGEIVFTTAYDHYAIDAIRISAFDYLLKPVSIAELQQTVERLLKNKNSQVREKLEVLQQSLAKSRSQADKIAVPTQEGLDFIRIGDIVHIESSANYSRVNFLDGRSILVTKLLKEFEDILTPYDFYRVHNSHLINLKYIDKYIRGDGGQVVLQNGEVVDVARRKKEEFLKLLQG